MTRVQSKGAGQARSKAKDTLSPREREVLGHLADGLTGALVAERLNLSPETVRAHVRNAMTKLGASTRSHAVALAIRRGVLGGEAGEEPAPVAEPLQTGSPDPRPRKGSRRLSSIEVQTVLGSLIESLASFYDVDSGAIFATEDDELTLRRVAIAGRDQGEPFGDYEEVALGLGPIGRAALERRAQVIVLPGAGPVAVVPARTGGRLVALLCLRTRASRPFERNELLLLQTLATRLADSIADGSEGASARLREDLEDFTSLWSAP